MEYNNSDGMKEVYFHEYCMTCRYGMLKDQEEPCFECLDNPLNYQSHKPVNYEDKDA